MAKIAENMPEWLIALLQGFNYEKIKPMNFNKLLVSIGYYIKSNKLLIDNEVIKIERNINVPQELLDKFYFIDYNKIVDGEESRKFRQDIYNFIKKYLED